MSSSAPMESQPPRRRTGFSQILLITLTLALILSLLANVRLYRSQGETTPPIRTDLLSEQQFTPANAALGDLEPGRVRIVFAGDSDISLWDPLPEVKGGQIIQRGFGGDRTGDLLERLERDVVELKAAVAVLTIGGNDLEDIAIFPEQEEAIVNICERNLRFMVTHLRQQHIQVVLLPIFPYGETESPQPAEWQAIYKAVDRVNEMVLTLKGDGVTVVDCNPVLTEANGRRKGAYSLDMEHLNSAGYREINKILTPVLEEVGHRGKD